MTCDLLKNTVCPNLFTLQVDTKIADILHCPQIMI